MRTLLLGLTLIGCTADGDPDTTSGTTVEAEPWDTSGWPTEVGGPDRPAKVQFPASTPSDQELPLIVLLHGFTANATLQEYVYHLGKRVDRYGFVLLLPEGTKDSRGDQFWNATEWCCDLDNSGVDDSGYLRSIIEEVEAGIPIDPDRIYIAGHSNGGYMSYRMACDHSDKIAAIAPLAGLMLTNPADCEAADPVSVLHSHGTIDIDVPYGYADPSVAFWAERAGCGAGISKDGRRDYEVIVDGKETAVSRYDDSCDPGFVGELWTMEGVGHLPGFNDDWRDDLVEWLLERRKL